MALHFIALVFSVCSLVLLLFSNLGTTFTSTILPNIYLVQINEAVTGRYIRYGVYNSCLYYSDSHSPHSCTKAAPAYHFNGNQFAEACGADMTNSTMVKIYTDVVAAANLVTFQGIVLIMPSVILVFASLICTLLIRRLRDNNIIPFVGAFTSLTGFLSGGAGLALTIATFWKGLGYLEKRVEGLSHQWGPAIYLVGIGSGCILITLVCFFISLFTSRSSNHDRETYNLYDYDLDTTKHNSAYDSPTALLNQPKHDSYGYSNNHVTSSAAQNYHAYNQNNNYHQNYY